LTPLCRANQISTNYRSSLDALIAMRCRLVVRTSAQTVAALRLSRILKESWQMVKKHVRTFEHAEYLCEGCNESYSLPAQAKHCEAKHNCKHKTIRYRFVEDRDGPEMWKTCTTCGNSWPSIWLWNLTEKQKEKLYDQLSKGQVDD